MVKRAGCPEDSTQSAYSSQLIRIPPLRHHFLSFLFYFSRGSKKTMVGRWSESVIRGTRSHTHTHFHIWSLRMILSASDMMMSALQAHLCVYTNFQSLCLYSFVWPNRAVRLKWSVGEGLLSDATREQATAQLLYCKARSFNCSKRRTDSAKPLRGGRIQLKIKSK